MNDFYSDINSKFQEFLDEVKVTFNLYKTLTNDLKEKLIELEDKDNTLRFQNDKNIKLNSELRSKLQDADDAMGEYFNLKKELEDIKNELDKRESNLDSRQEALSVDRNNINEKEHDLLKREKFIEMEERRIKLFEYKLNLVAEDEEIKKKLKEIL